MRAVKSWSRALVVAAAIATFGSVAQAAVWVDNVGYVDNYGTSPSGGWSPVKVTEGNPYTYLHNILDNGFNPSSSIITSVSLDIWLADDPGSWLGLPDSESEKVSFRWEFDNTTWTAPQEVDGSIHCLFFLGCNWDHFSVSSSGTGYLVSALADGQLAVTLKATDSSRRSTADFYFKRSLLTVTGRSVQVPEPSTLALLGLGLLAVGFAGRRRFAKN